MGCCNVRILSYISASVQLVCCVIGLLVLIIAGIAANSDEFKDLDEGGVLAESATTGLTFCVVVCLIGIALLVTLIVGIQQKRPTLVGIYVYTNYVLLVLIVILIAVDVVMGIINESTASIILIDLLICLFFVGLEILCFAPIVLLHRKMSASPILPTTYNAADINRNKEFEMGLTK